MKFYFCQIKNMKFNFLKEKVKIKKTAVKSCLFEKYLIFNYYCKTSIVTLLFISLPAAVSLEAIGISGPSPRAFILSGDTP